jgi:hypothetical protein
VLPSLFDRRDGLTDVIVEYVSSLLSYLFVFLSVNILLLGLHFLTSHVYTPYIRKAIL